MIIELNYRKGYKSGEDTWTRIKSLVKCDNCGVKREVDKYSINKKSGYTYCQKCAVTIYCKENYSTKSEDFIKLQQETGYTLLDNIPENGQIKCNWLCPKGHNIFMSYNSIKHSEPCSYCSGKIQKTEKDYIELAEKLGIKFLGPLPENVYTKTNWLCKCGTPIFQIYHNVSKNRFCQKCGLEKITGKNHVMYNPNLSDEDRIQTRSIKEMDLWRKLVYKKFDRVCQKCNKKCKVHAHHIFNWSKYTNLRFIVENGITLCNSCHRKFHNQWGTKDNNIEQLENFLNKTILMFSEVHNRQSVFSVVEKEN